MSFVPGEAQKKLPRTMFLFIYIVFIFLSKMSVLKLVQSDKFDTVRKISVPQKALTFRKKKYIPKKV